MKKIIYLAVFLLTFITGYSQTYYYRYTHSVDNNKVKSKGGVMESKDSFYLTFSEDKSYVYFSDKEGIVNGTPFTYIQNKNNILTYQYIIDSTKGNLGESASRGYKAGICMTLNFPYNKGELYMHFNQSFSKLNIRHSEGRYVHVYERVSSPEDLSIPDELY